MSSAAQSSESAPRTIVHKFGGTSVADAERYRHVAGLLLARDEQVQVTVVSAMKGVTDALIKLCELASASRSEWREPWHELRARHRGAVVSLLGEDSGPTLEWLDERFDKLAEILAALSVIGELPREVLDRVQGLGEVCSARLLGDYLKSMGEDCAVLDAREVLVVDRSELGVEVDWETSAARLAEWRARNPQRRVVVTGFVARDRAGPHRPRWAATAATTAARSSPRLFDAAELHIWTDVDGVLSADPRVVPEAVQLSALSYDEACELAYFGAKVVHPQTMSPAIERGLPIIIRNTFHPEHPGTRITAERDVAGPVKGLTLSADLAVLNLEGTGLIGVPGTAERVFAALREARVSVVMISQGSSEHSICCVVRAAESRRAQSRAAHRVRARTQHRPDPARATHRRRQRAGRGRRRHGRAAGRRRAPVRIAGPRARQHPRDRPGRLGAQHLRGHRQRRRDQGAARRACGFLAVAADLRGRGDRPGQCRRAPCSTSCAPRSRSCWARPTWTCACAPSRPAAKMLLDERGISGDWRERFAAASQALDLDAFTAHLRRLAPAAPGDRRLQRQRRGRRSLRRLAGRGHPRGHAEQAGRRRPAARATTPSAKRPPPAARVSATKPRSARACR